jgi:hypothetical protein
MRKEYNNEFNEAKSKVEKEIQEIEKQKENKEIEKENKEVKEKPKQEDTTKNYIYKRAYELHQDGLSDRKIAEELGVKSHKTAKKYYEKYQKQKDQFPYESIGQGIMPEEIEF